MDSTHPPQPSKKMLVEKNDFDDVIDHRTGLPQIPFLLSSASVENGSSTSTTTSGTDILPYDYISKEWLGAKAIVVHDVLSADECQQVIGFMQSEAASMIPAHTRVDYRNNMRTIAASESMASEIYRRLLPVLRQLNEDAKTVSKENAEDFHDNGLGMEGRWNLDGLNECFRLCYYNPGGHFAPHYDTDYVVDPVAHRSIKTMMIYLNDEYLGGETNFLDDHSLFWDDDRKLYCAPPGTVRASLKARRGDAIIFDHKLLHEGAQVVQGQKYVMRSELMYRIAVDEGAAAAGQQQPAELLQALKLLQEAKIAEGNGEMDKAVSLYRRAFRLYPEIEKFA